MNTKDLPGMEYTINLMELEAEKQGKAEQTAPKIAAARKLLQRLKDLAAKHESLSKTEQRNGR